MIEAADHYEITINTTTNTTMDYKEVYNYKKTVTLPKGLYFIGDPCCAIPKDDWKEFITGVMQREDQEKEENPLGLLVSYYKGCACATFGTGKGDGCWRDTDGFIYGVDSGTLGLTPLVEDTISEVQAPLYTDVNNSGRIIVAGSSIDVTHEHGTITISYMEAISGRYVTISIPLRRPERAKQDHTKWKKVIEWSDEDKCYLGSLPGRAFGACCHGDTEEEVLSELKAIAEELALDARDRQAAKEVTK